MSQNSTQETNNIVVGQVTSGGGEIFNDYENNIASAAYSHAEGEKTKATGQAAHAEGKSTVSGATGAHAEGWASTATGIASHAECYSTAEGNYSHAEGYLAKTTGANSHAEGKQTTLTKPLSAPTTKIRPIPYLKLETAPQTAPVQMLLRF